MVQTPSSNDPHPERPPRRRLDAWKEIATYLKRDVATVRRWEKREGLPVHRHVHHRLGSVYGFTDEIDEWFERRSRPVSAAEHARETVDDDGRPESAATSDPRGFRRFHVWSVGVSALGVLVLATSSVSDVSRPRTIRGASVDPERVLVHALVLSPDGKRVAFSASAPAGIPRLWIQEQGSTESEPLPETEGAAFPFWSPDGGAIGFFAGGKLKRITLSTRAVRHDLAEAPDGHGGTWSNRDMIVFAPDVDGPLFGVPASGGPAAAVTSIGSSHLEGHGWPEFLPDGRHFLYTDYSRDRNRYGIYVGDLETSLTRRLLAVFSSASYAMDGFLLYAHDGLVAQPFDAERLELAGEAVRVADPPLQHYELGHKVDFSVAKSGLLAVRTGTDEQKRLVWFDSIGRVVGELGNAALYSNPALSPKGQALVVTVTSDDSGPANLWLFDVASGAKSVLTNSTGLDFAPVWSPEADRIIFASTRNRRLELFQRSVSRGATDVRVLDASMGQSPETWTSDGRYLTFSTMRAGTKSDVWALPLDGERSPFPVLQSASNEGQSQVSPDGRFIAYTSDETGRFEVYVQSFPTPKEKWQISRGGGFEPRWRRHDGRELFYIAADRKLMAVDVQTIPQFRYGAARPLFDSQLTSLWQDTRNHYEVAPDGRRFLIMVPRVDPRSVAFTMLTNWQQALSASRLALGAGQ